jgi:2'-5' RNA ligase
MAERLFIAVIPPAQVIDAMEALVGPRRESVAGWRWSRPENWHITLAFLGDVDDDRRDALSEHLDTITAHQFQVRLGGAGAFRKEDTRDTGGDLPALKARTIWLGVRQGAEELAALSARTRAAASRAGVNPDGAKFTPHVTLARAGRPSNARGLLDAIASFGDFEFGVDAFHLVKSTLTPSGSIYEVAETFGLE